MELAKITSKGQITIPVSIRKILNLKGGDKIAFIENGDNFIVVNPISLAIDSARKELNNVAKEQNLNTEEDAINLVKKCRKEIIDNN